MLEEGLDFIGEMGPQVVQGLDVLMRMRMCRHRKETVVSYPLLALCAASPQ
jgi:hypothetical protein